MSANLQTRDERILSLVSGFALLAMMAGVAIGKPGAASFLPPCPLHAFTGWFCPGCGSTRALWYLVHGHPLAALGENALAVLLLPFLGYDLGASITRRWRSITSRLPPWSGWALLIVILLFAILRNIPLFPFSALAPTDLH